MIDLILPETICLFCFCDLLSMNYKIKSTAKNWPDLYKFNIKVNVWNFCLRFLLLFFAEFALLMFHNNIVKIKKKKDLVQVTYPTDFCIICTQFTMGKSKSI